jgi:hypothetical protein
VTAEIDIQQDILLALGQRSDLCRLWRINAGTTRAWDAPRAIKGAPAGHPDVTGIIKGGRWFGLEVKKPGEKQTEQQVRFEAMVVRFGGLYAVVRSVAEAIATVERWAA